MDNQLRELFYDEVDRGRLVFEDDPEYNALLAQSQSLFPNADLPDEIGRLLDISGCISFAHGLKLGLKLKRWVAR